MSYQNTRLKRRPRFCVQPVTSISRFMNVEGQLACQRFSTHVLYCGQCNTARYLNEYCYRGFMLGGDVDWYLRLGVDGRVYSAASSACVVVEVPLRSSRIFHFLRNSWESGGQMRAPRTRPQTRPNPQASASYTLMRQLRRWSTR